MLDEAYHYARYVSNTDSLQLLSRTAEWLTHTFENAAPASESLTSDLKVLLKSLIEAEETRTKDPSTNKGASQTAL